MADDVTNFAASSGPDIYYDPAFMAVLEDHMTFLRQHNKTLTIPVQPIQAERYRFDLRGLLFELKISAQLHYAVMRMNEITSTQRVDSTLTQLLVPDETVISSLAAVSRSATTM